MKTFSTLLLAAMLGGLFAGLPTARAEGFTEPDVLFYGEVRKSGGGQTVLLQAGQLEMTFVNQSDPNNRVTIQGGLYPVGNGTTKPFSYALKVPLAYLPAAPRIGSFLAVTTQPTSFKIEGITVDGIPATLPDGSKEFYGLSFASRSGEYRLDLLVAGDSVSTAHDGIPDWWKTVHGLDLTLDVAGDDPDGDGWTNLQEFNQGSDPTRSNLDPQLVSTEIRVPESGEAGLFPQFLDSDTADGGIDIALTPLEGGAFQLQVDGVAMASGTTWHFSLEELKSGRVSLKHTDRTVRQGSLPMTWNDGSGGFSGRMIVSVVSPSFEDGSDSALWLNGSDLPADGTRISSWPDRSGNGRSAMQPLAEYRPIATSGTADFSANPQAHLFFQDTALPSGDHTVLACYRAASVSDRPQTLLSTNRGFLQIAATTQAVSYPGAATYQIDDRAVRSFEDATGAVTCSIFRREGGLLQNLLATSYSGENIALVEFDPVLPTLGIRRSAIPGEDNSLDQQFCGQLHELLVFPGALAEQKLRGVNDYLQSKWTGAVIWNFSSEMKSIRLTAGAGTQRRIIRGGFGSDSLAGSGGDDVISGGAGDDILAGGGGGDRFLFGALDTGRDHITDFDPQADIIDLSAIFWGTTGDARQWVSVRLDTNYDSSVPTLDTTLIVKRVDGPTQEIVLQNTVIGSTQLIRLIAEGHLLMGGLSIPTTVQLSLASGGLVAESLAQPFTVSLTRSGAGVPAALDVPIGLFGDETDGRFVVDGAASSDSRRFLVNFARGETSKSLVVRPVPDLQTTGLATVQLAVLPQFRYSISGSAITQSVTDQPRVWLQVIQSDATASPLQNARLRICRDGNLAQSMNVSLRLGGTALNGVHVEPVADSITIAAGQDSREIQVAARAAGLSAGPKVLLVQLSPCDTYLLGKPHEGLIYVGSSPEETTGAGFDRWLQAFTHGAMTSLADLRRLGPERTHDYLRAYAFGISSLNELDQCHLSIRIVGGRPELSLPGKFGGADLRWGVDSSNDLGRWRDAGTDFAQSTDADGLHLTGPQLGPAAGSGFYRLNMCLDPGQLAGSGIAAMTGSADYGMSGNAIWHSDQSTGNLVGGGGTPGQASRLIANIAGPVTIDFEMAVDHANGTDTLVFYIDGVRQVTSTGAAVRFRKTWAESGGHLLMWEFTQGSGNAVIRNLMQ